MQPAAQLRAPVVHAVLIGLGPASSAAIALGGSFQTRLNHSTKTSTSAWRPGPAGHSGGSGRRFSSQRTMRIESETTSPWSASSTGHEVLAGERDDGRAVVGVDVDPVDRDDLWARASATRSTLVEYGIR